MTQEHPITPPPELIEDWIEIAKPLSQRPPDPNVLVTLAARWGADKQLSICLKWLQDRTYRTAARELQEHCRPKPKSQAEEALAEIEELEDAMYSAGLGRDFTATRTALERLRELEGGNG